MRYIVELVISYKSREKYVVEANSLEEAETIFLKDSCNEEAFEFVGDNIEEGTVEEINVYEEN